MAFGDPVCRQRTGTTRDHRCLKLMTPEWFGNLIEIPPHSAALSCDLTDIGVNVAFR